MMMAWFLAPPKHCAALAGGCGALIDILRDRGRADKADRLDVGIVEDGVDRFLVAVDDVEDARRQPRLQHQFGKPHRHAGIALRWFQHERVAAGNRRRELPHRDHRRKIERRDAGNDAERLTHRIDVDAWPGAFGIFTFHHLRNAERELHDLDAAQNIALRVGNGLAVFAGKQFGQGVIVARHQFQEFHEDANAALRVGGGPFRLRRLGIFDRRTKFGLGGQRHLGLDGAGHRLEDVREPARGALDLTATDEMSDCAHENPP